MEDRALMCMGCARHHNEIKVFHTHELVPLSGSYFDPRGEREHNTVQANTNHLNAVMGNGSGNAFRPNPNVNPTMSQMALQSYREREDALLRPPAAYRGLISSRPGSLTGPGGMGLQGLQGHGQGQDLGPPIPSSISAGAYTSNIRNKVIHVTPATFHLIRSNAALLEDIKVTNNAPILLTSSTPLTSQDVIIRSLNCLLVEPNSRILILTSPPSDPRTVTQISPLNNSSILLALPHLPSLHLTPLTPHYLSPHIPHFICFLTSLHLTSLHFTLPHFTLPHLTSPTEF